MARKKMVLIFGTGVVIGVLSTCFVPIFKETPNGLSENQTITSWISGLINRLRNKCAPCPEFCPSDDNEIPVTKEEDFEISRMFFQREAEIEIQVTHMSQQTQTNLDCWDTFHTASDLMSDNSQGNVDILDTISEESISLENENDEKNNSSSMERKNTRPTIPKPPRAHPPKKQTVVVDVHRERTIDTPRSISNQNNQILDNGISSKTFITPRPSVGNNTVIKNIPSIINSHEDNNLLRNVNFEKTPQPSIRNISKKAKKFFSIFGLSFDVNSKFENNQKSHIHTPVCSNLSNFSHPVGHSTFLDKSRLQSCSCSYNSWWAHTGAPNIKNSYGDQLEKSIQELDLRNSLYQTEPLDLSKSKSQESMRKKSNSWDFPYEIILDSNNNETSQNSSIHSNDSNSFSSEDYSNRHSKKNKSISEKFKSLLHLPDKGRKSRKKDSGNYSTESEPTITNHNSWDQVRKIRIMTARV